VLLAVAAGCGLEPTSGIRIERAAKVVDAATDPPPPGDARWTDVTLPDRWPFFHAGGDMLGWYRATVTLPAPPGELWAVALPVVSQNAAVRVNGQPVGDGGPFAPMARNWNRPLLFTVPPGLLGAGTNVIDVRVGAAGLAPPAIGRFHVGPASALGPPHARREALQVGVSRATTAAAVALLGLLGILLRHREYFPGGGWFLAALALLTIASVDNFLHESPIPVAAWDWLVTNARTAALLCIAVGIHRHLGLAGGARERVAWLVWAGSAVLLAWGPTWLAHATLGAYALAFLAVFVALARLARRRRETAARVTPAFLAVGVVGGAFVVHDGLRFAGVGGGPLFLTPYAFTVIVALEAVVLSTRLVRAWGGLLALNRELETRVQTKHAELEQSWARVRDLERERIVAEERRRITRDIHDGLGGHLVTTLAMLESAEEFSRDDVAEALRGALDDLRLVIDSLDPRETDLVGVLATIRARIEPRLRLRGLRFRWEVADLPPAPGLGPERLLRVLRVVQEAITNVLKHARATTITVRTGVASARGAYVSVDDDGRGFAPERAEGRGLVNMQRRAAELGGALEIATGPAGTSVTLWLPADGQGLTSPS
jgi:signal transduction histidine kinase